MSFLLGMFVGAAACFIICALLVANDVKGS